ncbi:MAG: ferritin-like domain-containing protein [Planctomycetota bacterium]
MNDTQRQAIVDLLRTSYNMEIETVANYLANSIHLDGFKAKHIKDALAADITEELTHATQLAQRIKVLEGRVPGSQELAMNQTSLQPPENQLDVLSVIHGVIDAEEGAIAQYQKIIEACDGVDPVTEDLATTLKGDEEEHRRLFKGFLAEMLADQ